MVTMAVKDTIKSALNPVVRRWAYGVCLVSFPVLVHYGLVEPEAAPLWAGFALALLNVEDEG
jgi:hypothetical protein